MKTVTLEIEFKDHRKVVLTDKAGNTYTSKSEELIDFLHGSSKSLNNNCKFYDWCDSHYHYKGEDNWTHGSGGNEKNYKTSDLFYTYKSQGN